MIGEASDLYDYINRNNDYGNNNLLKVSFYGLIISSSIISFHIIHIIANRLNLAKIKIKKNNNTQCNEFKKNKLKNFYYKIKKRIGIYLLLIVGIIVLLHFLLKLFDLQFRECVYEMASIIFVIGLSICIIQEFNDPNSKIGKIMWYGGAFLTFFCVGIVGIILLMINSPMIEHTVERDGCKYVAKVDIGLLHTTVYFHKYVNFFLMDSQSEFEKSYRGAYDPIAREKEKNNDKAIKKETDIIEDSKIQKINPDDILYKKEIMLNTSIRVINVGNELGGKTIIKIQKTTDGGNTWEDQLETVDKAMTINNGAKFIFLDENIGFINNLSLIGTDKQNNGLLVTTNGGKSFKNATIILSSNIEDTVFYVSDIPYIENGKLKVKLYSANNKTVYTEFYSEDNGLTWK